MAIKKKEVKESPAPEKTKGTFLCEKCWKEYEVFAGEPCPYCGANEPY